MKFLISTVLALVSLNGVQSFGSITHTADTPTAEPTAESTAAPTANSTCGYDNSHNFEDGNDTHSWTDIISQDREDSGNIMGGESGAGEYFCGESLGRVIYEEGEEYSFLSGETLEATLTRQTHNVVGKRIYCYLAPSAPSFSIQAFTLNYP